MQGPALEDFVPGTVTTYGRRAVTRDEIVSFAAQFDPQPMHLDEEAAKNSVLGGLAASGWQGSAILIRLAVEAYANKSAAMASSGMDEVKWLKPVYAGETSPLAKELLKKTVYSKSF
jgi:acyl dehydratase